MPQMTKDITLGDISVTVKELTVADIFEKLDPQRSGKSDHPKRHPGTVDQINRPFL